MPSDDPDHALLLARRAVGVRGVDVFALESDRAPVEVHRPSGELFAEVQGAARVAGRWYLATSQSGADRPATVVWVLDGSGAREVARLPRIGGDLPAPSRLAHRTDGAGIGLVVDGKPGLDRSAPPRWVVAIDLESGALSDPEPLAPVDLSDSATAVCTGDDAGWLVDLPYTGPVRVHVGSAWTVGLQYPAVRVRLSHASACLERVSGTTSDAQAVDVLTRPGNAHTDARAVDASIFASRVRYGLRCAATR
jgi:hypothetical protein